MIQGLSAKCSCARLPRPVSIRSRSYRMRNMARREADIAVRIVRPEQQARVMRRAGSIHYGFYASRSYVRARGLLEDPADLPDHVVIGFDRSALMVRGAKRLGLDWQAPDFAFRCDDRVVQWAAVVGGVGVGVLPTYLASDLVLTSMRMPSSKVWLTSPKTSSLALTSAPPSRSCAKASPRPCRPRSPEPRNGGGSRDQSRRRGGHWIRQSPALGGARAQLYR